MNEIKNQFMNLKEKAHLEISNHYKPDKTISVTGFFASSAAAWNYIFSEKENILFALLQWGVIAIMYYIWVQGLNWIPDEVWEKAGKDGETNAANLVLLVWSFICVGVSAFPLSILNSCMSASLILHYQRRESTVLECLKIVLHNLGTLWVFTWIDGWWTVLRIMERLPRRRTASERSKNRIDEAMYQAWKFATLGFIPSILFGRKLKGGCFDCIKMIKSQFIEMAKLRIGYIVVCWLVSISCYIGGIYLCCKYREYIFNSEGVYPFYMVMGVPLIIALLVIMVVFRPIYVISACKLYIHYSREEKIQPTLPQTSPKFYSLLAVFIALCGIIGVALLYHNKIGIDDFIHQYLVNSTSSIQGLPLAGEEYPQ